MDVVLVLRVVVLNVVLVVLMALAVVEMVDETVVEETLDCVATAVVVLDEARLDDPAAKGGVEPVATTSAPEEVQEKHDKSNPR